MAEWCQPITRQDALEGKDKHMALEENRLTSFIRWPFTDGKCTKEEMSGCGFYHCNIGGKLDGVRCFFCLKELDGWDRNDDPWTEHKRNNSCYFANLAKREMNMTVREFLKAMEEREINLMQKQSQDEINLAYKLMQDLGLIESN